MKIAVMVSGGLDSFILYHYALKSRPEDEIIPVYVRYGCPYQDKEDESVNTLFFENEDLIIVNADLATEELDNVPTLEQQEIFGRNLLMLFYGAVVAEEVWLASLSTEMNPTAVRDKQPEFLHMCSMMFTYLFKNKRFETSVKAPFSEYTKSDIVSMAIHELGISKETLMLTSTCYHETEHNCGKCSTCFKRWIAMINNDISEKYVSHPYYSDYAQHIVDEMAKTVASGIPNDRFSPERLAETDSALNKIGFRGLLLETK